MCGINGIFSKRINKREARQAIGLMNRLQRYRGPDDEGIFQSGPVAFGHRRLSILDLSKAGHQPMEFSYSVNKLLSSSNNSITNNSITITLNGEIYNFLELKKKLSAKGYKFKTKTDTEVILALYSEYGQTSFSMLRGMFAFALWDDKQKKLFLVKDRYGIKPLYYYADKEKLIFASTVKAIEKSGLIPVQKNPQALIGFLLFGSVPLPMTTIKNVLGLPAGHYLVRDASGRQNIIQYYDSLAAFHNKKQVNFEEASQRIRSLLEESVNLHLISDAPLGVFLSGGLDSSSLASLAALQRKKPIITLSVDFEEKEFSEKEYQDLMVEKIKSEHRQVIVRKNEFYESFEDIFKAMDQPTIDGVNTFFIAKAAKEAGLKVVLSGLGSDEIFAGYPFFKRAEFIRRIQNLPSFVKMPLSLFSLFGDRYSKLSYFKDNNILSFYLGIRGLFASQEVAKILDINLDEVTSFVNNFSQLQHYSIKALEELRPIDLVSYLELELYLQNQLLKDTDFMSMYHSIEVRVPFLDHLLVEYLSSLPPETKVNSYSVNKLLSSAPNNSITNNLVTKVNKPLLVAAVHDLLPQEIFTRPKMGFTFPFEKWLRREVNNYSVDKLLSFSNNSITNNLITKFKSGKLHWSRLWAIYVIKQAGL